MRCKGERTEALKLYAACRDALKQDLGVAPDCQDRGALPRHPHRSPGPTVCDRCRDRTERPTGRRSPYCPSAISAAIRARPSSATASPKTPSPASAAFVSCSSSTVIRHRPYRSRYPTLRRSDVASASPISCRAACSGSASTCASPCGSSMPDSRAQALGRGLRRCLVRNPGRSRQGHGRHRLDAAQPRRELPVWSRAGASRRWRPMNASCAASSTCGAMAPMTTGAPSSCFSRRWISIRTTPSPAPTAPSLT